MSNEVTTVDNNIVETDFNESRRTIQEIIVTADKAIQEVSDLAFQSQSPAFYRELSSLLKTQIEASRDLVGIHKTKREIQGGQVQRPTQTQNNLIVTSAELLNTIIKQNKIEEIVVEESEIKDA